MGNKGKGGPSPGSQGTIDGLNDVGGDPSKERSSRGAERRWYQKGLGLLSSSEKGNVLSKNQDAIPENYMETTDLGPISAEEQAERQRILFAAEKIKEKDAFRHRHTGCISQDEALERQNRINTLESENAALKKDVDKYRNQLDEYWKLMKKIGPLFGMLRPKYKMSVDETGRQPPDWTLSYCFQQFEALEVERIDRETFFQQKLSDKDAQYQQQIRNKDTEHQREEQNLQNQINNAINLHEEKKAEMKSEHDQAIQNLTDKHEREKERLQGEITRMEAGLLTNVDRFQPLPDPTFKKKFTDLKRLVENMARNLPDVEGAVMASAFAETKFVRAAEFVGIAPKKHWRYLLEGTFWHIIMRGLFATPFSVFGIYGHDYLDYWHDLFEQQRGKPEPGSEQWRSVTFETLHQQIEVRPELKQSHEMNLRNISEQLAEVLRNFSQYKPDDIRNIVDLAHKLALDIGMQRSRLQLFAPELGTMVKRNTKTYDDVNNSNANDLARGVVQLVASPGLRRYGDGRGYTFNEEPVDLWPAAVYLTA